MERFEIGRDNLTLRGGLHPDSRDISKVESWETLIGIDWRTRISTVRVVCGELMG